MLIGGLWHGANWTFVFWGFLHGLYLIVQRIAGKQFGKIEDALRLPKWLQTAIDVAIVYSLTCFAWIFFRAPNFSVAWQVIRKCASLDGMGWNTVLDKFLVIKAGILISILLFAELMNNNLKNLQELAIQNSAFRVTAFAALLILIAFFGTFGASAFIYFQF